MNNMTGTITQVLGQTQNKKLQVLVFGIGSSPDPLCGNPDNQSIVFIYHTSCG